MREFSSIKPGLLLNRLWKRPFAKAASVRADAEAAVVGPNPAGARGECERAVSTFGLDPGRRPALFSLYGCDLAAAADEEDLNNFAFLAADFKDRFDLVAVSGGGFRLYATEWHRALVECASQMVKPGGVLAFGAETSATVDRSTITQWLNGAPFARRDSYDCFLPKPPARDLAGGAQTRSVFSWYAARGPKYARALAAGFRDAPEIDLAALGVSAAPGKAQSEKRMFPLLDDSPDPSRARVRRDDFHSLEYLSLGAGAKAAYIKHILQTSFPADRPLKICDHGSAAGMVPLQLLLEPDLMIEQAWAIEPLDQFLAMTADLYRAYAPAFSGRFFYDHAYAEGYDYPERMDAISMIHMLLLLDPEKREAVLRRAWEALNPGGVLIALEIPKTEKSRSAAYFDKMLPAAEIERLLSLFGPVQRLHPTRLREISRRDAGAAPVFRYVKKGRPEGPA